MYRAAISIFFLSLVCCSVFGQKEKAFLKNIETNYVAIVTDSMFASQCECSNEDYAQFIKKICNNPTEYSRYNYDSTGWVTNKNLHPGLIPNETRGAHTSYYHWHPGYLKYPVVNITFEAAQAYCAWLTKTYNEIPNRKYKQVEFRLPTKTEWEKAALAIVISKDHGTRILPWYGSKFIDDKGRYLANFQPLEDYQIKRNVTGELVLRPELQDHSWYSDNALYTSPCDIQNKKKAPYPPNDFGLYHVAGNVSEMLQEKGKTKGGSFLSPGYYLLVTTNEDEFPHQELGGPYIGFRPFMYVVTK